MLLIERLAIGPQDNTGAIHDKLAAMGAQMVVKVLRKMEQGIVEAVPQPDTGVTYAAKISKEEAAQARKYIPLILQGVTPGKCDTKERCETYCKDPANALECMEFAVKYAGMCLVRID